MIDLNFWIGRILKHFSFQLLALIALILCLVSACGNDFSQDNLYKPQLQTSGCRAIKHSMGETCVPNNPQRVITTDPFSLENILAFGIQPIGIATSSETVCK